MLRVVCALFLLITLNGQFVFSSNTIISDNEKVWDIALLNGDTIAYCTGEPKLKFYSLKRKAVAMQYKLPAVARKIAVDDEKQLIALGLENGNIALFSVKDKTIIKTIKAYKHPITDVKLSPATVMAASYEPEIKVYDINSYKPVFNEEVFKEAVLCADKKGEMLALSGYAEGVKVFKNYELIRTIAAHSTNARVVALSASGNALATANDRGMLHIWNTADWSLRAYSAGSVMINAVSFSPSELFVAAVNDDGNIYVLDAAKKRKIAVIEGYKNPATACMFLKDEKFLAVAYLDNTVKLIDWQNRKACLKEPAEIAGIKAGRGAKITVNLLDSRGEDLFVTYGNASSTISRSSVCYAAEPEAFVYLHTNDKVNKRIFYVLSQAPLENFSYPAYVQTSTETLKFDPGNFKYSYQFSFDYSKESTAYLSAFTPCGKKLSFSVNSYKKDDKFLPFAVYLRAKDISEVLYEDSKLVLRRTVRNERFKARGYLAGWYYLADGGRIYADKVSGG